MINANTPLTPAMQQQVEMLHRDADKLFALDWLYKELCAWHQKQIAKLDPAQPEEFCQFMNQPTCQFATQLLKNKRESLADIRILVDYCFVDEVPLQQLYDLREKLIDQLCGMGFTLSWYNVRRYNDSWMRFANRMPFNHAGSEEIINRFFKLICHIALITDVYDHRGGQYGIDIDYSDFDQVERTEGSRELTNEKLVDIVNECAIYMTQQSMWAVVYHVLLRRKLIVANKSGFEKRVGDLHFDAHVKDCPQGTIGKAESSSPYLMNRLSTWPQDGGRNVKLRDALLKSLKKHLNV